MAFTRQNTGTSTTFIREGALTATSNTPPFQLFQKSSAQSTFSLGGNWKIRIDNTLDTLQFLNNTTSILTLNNSGFTMDAIILPSQEEDPVNPAVGTLANVNNTLKIYI